VPAHRRQPGGRRKQIIVSSDSMCGRQTLAAVAHCCTRGGVPLLQGLGGRDRGATAIYIRHAASPHKTTMQEYNAWCARFDAHPACRHSPWRATSLVCHICVGPACPASAVQTTIAQSTQLAERTLPTAQRALPTGLRCRLQSEHGRHRLLNGQNRPPPMTMANTGPRMRRRSSTWCVWWPPGASTRSTWSPTVGRHVGLLHLGRGGASYIVGQGCVCRPTRDGRRQKQFGAVLGP